MSLSVIFRPQAEEDLQKIHQWYESQQPGLGEDLLRIPQKVKLSCWPFSMPSVIQQIGRENSLHAREQLIGADNTRASTPAFGTK